MQKTSKNFYKNHIWLILGVNLIALLGAVQWALADSDLETKVRQLEQEVEQLKKQSNPIQTAVNKLNLEISGVLEAEASWNRNYADQENSDLTLATAELDFDAQVNDLVKGHITLLWEEDDTEPVDIDEAYILLGNTDNCPFYLQVGRLYVPFGSYDTNMISDPLTLSLGEIYESAAVLGYEAEGISASVFVYNGEKNEASDSDDQIDNFGLNLGYEGKISGLSISSGISYVNDLADNDDALGDTLPDNLNDYVPGLALHACLNWDDLNLITEYVTALDDFAKSELAYKGDGARPQAWNIEGGYTMTVLDHETTLAIAYQGTSEAVEAGLPKYRLLGSVSVALFEDVDLSLEYAYDQDYDLDQGGTDEDAQALTAQLHVEF